jgi:aminopeptidase 2
VKEQDIYLPAIGLRAHVEGTEALFTWMKDNWDTLSKKLPPTMSMLGTMVSICTSNFTSEEALSSIEAFFKDKDNKGYDQALAQSLDVIRSKANWLARDRQDVKEWVEKNTKGIKSEL